jgi:hypothetical protein
MDISTVVAILLLCLVLWLLHHEYVLNCIYREVKLLKNEIEDLDARHDRTRKGIRALSKELLTNRPGERPS